MYTLNCRGKIIVIDQPLVMGVLNITDDSFYKGFLGSEDIVYDLAANMLEQGAAILDIGGQSSRPGSVRLSAEEEMNRVIPVIQSIIEKFPDVVISIDTYHSSVASVAVNAGASIINDISFGDMDPEMLPLAGSLGVPYIGMHMKGRPETMQNQPYYENVTREVLEYFALKIDECNRAGINDLILDPGFGFGKTIVHNFQLLRELEILKIAGKPILAGLSRKSTIYKTLDISADEALNGTTVLNTIALLNGADILRVHDVKEARETVRLISAYKKAAS